ncbi:MAG: nicotinamide riboside transporter PnuC [Bacteroidales bacterium]|nr:MAG: nicotinamide riboside transporter PnuC [Bacteroidales bacterium]
MEWLLNNYVEVLGAIAGLIYLYLEIKQNIWLWPLGIITSAFYVYVFFVSKFYADMGLQVFYLVISFYGWWHWLYGGNSTSKHELPITRTSLKQWIYLTLITIFLFGLMVFILKNYTDSPVPYGDSFVTALSITGTWMLARKLIEHWWIWVVVNLVSLVLFIWKDLYPTSILFFFYFTLAVYGYYQWKKEMVKGESQKTKIKD